MASLSAIRDGIKTTIEANISTLQVYDTMPDQINGDSVLVEPESSDFFKSFGRGLDQYTFNLYVLVPWVETGGVQDSLDSYITGAGAKSVRQVIFQNQTLGVSDTTAYVSKMFGYGGTYKVANTQHIGAVLKLIVLTDGSV